MRGVIANLLQFSKIPGCPISYWVSKKVLNIFEIGTKLGEIASPKQGLASADNSRFLRLWYEVVASKMFLNATDYIQAMYSGKKWFPCNKGGPYRKWFGNNEYLINWENNGAEIKSFSGSVIRNSNFYFYENATWTAISSGTFSVRYSPSGFIITNAGMAIYSDDLIKYIVAFMNTKCVSKKLLKAINQTLNFNAGDVERLPLIVSYERRSEIDAIFDRCTSLSKNDWDSFETSWDFKKHPLI